MNKVRHRKVVARINASLAPDYSLTITRSQMTMHTSIDPHGVGLSEIG
jgi:hypothetical protein